ncbi:MAG: hypothetical protein HYV06_04355 [Deltaproteobacteria bacterium]|nr:hypothetical protein [Deltaproteobacteria bacterium]
MTTAAMQPVWAYDALRGAVAKLQFVRNSLPKVIDEFHEDGLLLVILDVEKTVTEARKALTCFAPEAAEMFMRGEVYTYPERDVE